MDGSRVLEIRAEVERQRSRWNDMLKGAAKPLAGSYTLKGPVFRPHLSEEELEELLDLVEENRRLKEQLANVREVKIYGSNR